jgi:hypothetical protein
LHTVPRESAATTLQPRLARGDVATYRLPSGLNLRESGEWVLESIERAVAERQPSLLLDVRAYDGPSPDPGARHELMRAWASAAEGRVKVAMLLQERHIDPERFGVVAAGNFGLEANAFTDERSAVRWLQEVAGAGTSVIARSP